MNDIYRISFLLCVLLLITMIISCGPDEDSTKDDFLNDVSVQVTTMKQTIKDKIDQRDTDSFNEGDNIHLTVSIINNGNATGEDIKKLISEIKEEVKKKYDIDLKVEQEFVE